jgi:hypothetical protein
LIVGLGSSKGVAEGSLSSAISRCEHSAEIHPACILPPVCSGVQVFTRQGRTTGISGPKRLILDIPHCRDSSIQLAETG